ncbi:hydantoinase/oxoprolinase family protein [Paraburkholderia phymatum]|uniref:H4MPT-linked C1 transfer pathway protein n=1 Tax=Paraburkholderia phymatum (strain DSM 17167 / CIP 108236 / LMG 21445 / STM815) TaxID=391038 RepID=B2JVM4_PARP8|nr:hydantoinase/oxoprolinase family protein [Paraburkholderia phymatum]ACC75001.1 H4MPT-linked C1 transfer pathway protein [Paraburkholderia phymatum STM815]
MQRDLVIGWDIGGAHVKAARVESGRVCDVMQWVCPLWQGLAHLDAVFDAVAQRWPDHGDAEHAVTMSGEMADIFDDRATGVSALANRLAHRFGPRTSFYAGCAGWQPYEAVTDRWADVASANWHATAALIAARVPAAVLVDIGSTTTDFIAIREGMLVSRGSDDAQRLRSGELVYQGVVRTPLCALAQRIRFGGELHNVMNELFATTADIYRLTRELDPLHDQHPAADGGEKDRLGSCRRVARMIGRDAREASMADWECFAREWRKAQLAHLSANLAQVLGRVGLGHDVVLVAAGSGAFLADELAAQFGRDVMPFASLVDADDTAARWAQVCAPAVAVALLRADERCAANATV